GGFGGGLVAVVGQFGDDAVQRLHREVRGDLAAPAGGRVGGDDVPQGGDGQVLEGVAGGASGVGGGDAHGLAEHELQHGPAGELVASGGQLQEGEQDVVGGGPVGGADVVFDVGQGGAAGQGGLVAGPPGDLGGGVRVGAQSRPFEVQLPDQGAVRPAGGGGAGGVSVGDCSGGGG